MNIKRYDPYAATANETKCYGVRLDNGRRVKDYMVSNIHFYQDGEILVSTNAGYITKANGYPLASFPISQSEIKSKTIADYNKLSEHLDGTAFAVKVKDMETDEYTVELYIPAGELGIKHHEDILKNHMDIYEVYIGKHDIRIEKFLETVSNDLDVIEKEYNEILKSLTVHNMDNCNYNEFMSRITNLRSVYQKRYKEKKRLEKLTIDKIEIC